MLRSRTIAPEDTERTPEVWKEEIESIPVEMIQPNPFQPRVEFDQESLNELAQSIAEHGILHPVIVREVEDGYQLIVGERRLRACKQLGWQAIPSMIKELSDKVAGEMALIENLQRRDLHFFEEAEGYLRLLQDFDLTQEELAKRLGKSQSSIANRLRILKLGREIRAAIAAGSLSERHARSLLRLESNQTQRYVIDMVVEKELNVRQTEELIARLLEKKEPPAPVKQKRIIFKDIRLFTNSVKDLASSLTASGLDVDYKEQEEDEYYRVTVMIKKPERGQT